MKLMLKTAKLQHSEIREATKQMADSGRPKKDAKHLDSTVSGEEST